ncbi:low temperature requirement protein A [Micromonospora krabiensis]|uniref:Low temperature requirement protein LtrA n=1 Tax=Micromonospora krabiensis TaxID=307121 RepID=A0A1C3MYR3_9ACTN|nr:low temperature requirement protein A [Micromonospora krabiensis]SBV25445.1 Low temperature requirement protein LtrA [Micromonospora krabiensis]
MAMAAGGDAGAAGATAESPGRPAFLELFFDLAYVFALITLVDTFAGNLTWTGLAGTLLLLFPFSLVWAITTWAADLLGLSRPLVQVQFIAVAAASLLLAAAAPEAYGERALLFAVTYLAIHLGSSSYYLLLDRSPSEPGRSGRILSWYAVLAGGWVAGALIGGPAQLAIWGTAISVEYAGAWLGWPTPGLGRAHPRQWRLVGERVAERYRQFVIIALGAAIFITGTMFSLNEHTVDRAAALLVVFTGLVLMWRVYIYRAGELLTEAIARSTHPSRLTQSAAVTHLIMVAGIIGVAVTAHLVVVRPLGPTPPSWAAVILGAPALFLVGRGLLDYTVFARVSRSRLVGLALLAALAPVATRLPPIGVTALAMTVLLLIAGANLMSTRHHARVPTPPEAD